MAKRNGINMFNKKQEILKIEYENKFLWMPPITPAKSVVPDWYKSILPVSNDIKQLPISPNVKSCIPFLDSLTIGYTVPLPMDIAVRIDEEGFPIVSWEMNQHQMVGARAGDEAPIPTPTGFDETHFIWSTACAFKLPEGYSAVITHPLNRHDLPFMTLSGVVDADAIMHEGSIPFYIKKGFEGLIKMGTPIFQVIPFKREDWQIEEKKGLFEIGSANGAKNKFYTLGGYKKFQWKRKSYN
jgi:hypothetical protein